MEPKIIVSDFAVGRHFTPGQPYSFCELTCTELVERVKDSLRKSLIKPGYRDGVCLVPVSPKGIFSPVVLVTDENKHLLRTVFEARREGEEPLKKTVIDCPKSPAVAVDVVLYSRQALAEGNENSDPTADWEIVSVNARIQEEPEPMSPVALARNLLGLPGGTKAEFNAKNCEELAQGIMYWSKRVMATL